MAISIMKNISKFLILFAFVGLFAACDDDDEIVETTEEQSALSVTVNNDTFLGGDTVILTIFADDSQLTEPREDITFYLEAINTSDQAFADTLFTSFPETVVLSAYDSEVSVDLQVKDKIYEEVSVTLYVAAEGLEISDAVQTITICEYYEITLATVGGTTSFNEGDSFQISASVEKAVSSDLTLTLVYDDDVATWLTGYPESLTIAAGETSVTSGDITLLSHEEYYAANTINIGAVSSNDNYQVTNSLALTRMDARGDPLTSETWVYEYPEGTFYSSTLETSYLASSLYDEEKDMLMTRKSGAAVEASAHPNEDLAAEGWYLLAAHEFSLIDGCQGWSYGVDEKQSAYDNYYPFQSPRNGWSWQNTYAEEQWCAMTIYGSSKAKYTTVLTDDKTSYMRAWSGYEETTATCDAYAGEARYIGSMYLTACVDGTVLNRWTTITTGTRVEFRARVGGNRQGFHESIKLATNANIFSYVTVMGNPVHVDSPSLTTNIVQGVCSKNTDNETVDSTFVTTTLDPSDWNIYWVEINADNVVLGINGYTTATIPTTNLDYGSAFRIFIDQGVGSPDCGVPAHTSDLEDEEANAAELKASRQQEPTWLDSSLKSISFGDSITSDSVPHIEFDWIRVWGNDDWAGTNYGNANTKFF